MPVVAAETLKTCKAPVKTPSPLNFYGPYVLFAKPTMSTNWRQPPFSRWTWVSRCLLKQRMMEDGNNWSYKSCIAPVKSSPPTNQHPVFLQAGCPSCRPTNSVKALKGKYHIPWTCLPQAHLGVFQLWSLTTNSSWLPRGRFAVPLISPLMPVHHCHCLVCSLTEFFC